MRWVAWYTIKSIVLENQELLDRILGKDALIEIYTKEMGDLYCYRFKLKWQWQLLHCM